MPESKPPAKLVVLIYALVLLHIFLSVNCLIGTCMSICPMVTQVRTRCVRVNTTKKEVIINEQEKRVHAHL